jgi:hypothetical protein
LVLANARRFLSLTLCEPVRIGITAVIFIIGNCRIIN